jgi:small subunit ribosomal protein S35
MKPGSYTPASAVSPNKVLDAMNNAAEEVASEAPKELSEEDVAARQLARLVSDLKALDPSDVQDAQRKGQRGIPFATDWDFTRDEHFDKPEPDRRRISAGFWAEGEESMGVDEDFYGDDITSHGHGELEKHRELRSYNRLVAWEMPLLHRTHYNLIAWMLYTNNHYRIGKAFHTSHISNTLPLPLHFLPPRIAPRSQ